MLTKTGHEFSFPGWINDYNYGIKMSANALLLLVLNNAHTRYYEIYLKATELTFGGNLTDLAIKITLITATILQLVVYNIIILLTAFAYTLTFLRNLELLLSLDQENPLRKHIQSNWIFYNLRHNLVVWLFYGFFCLIKFKMSSQHG